MDSERIIPNDLYKVFITSTGDHVTADVYKYGEQSKLLHLHYQSEARAIASIKRRLKIDAGKKRILLYREPWIGRIETVGLI